MRVAVVKIVPNATALKRELSDPEPVCDALGLADGALQQARGLLVRCPWHVDTRPSCSITSAGDGTLRVKCFACGAGGDVFSLIAKVRGLDVRAEFLSVLHVAADLAAGLANSTGTSKPRVSPPTLETEAFDGLVQSLLRPSELTSSSRAGMYLARRGLLPAATADGWGALPEDPLALADLVRSIVAGGASDWRRSGLFTEAGDLKFRANVLLIPWRDENGLITTLQRRVIEGDQPRHKYVFPDGRPPCAPYGAAALSTRAPGEIVFVEGAVDVLAYRTLCARAGIRRTVLGLPGVAGWRSSWAAYGKGRIVHVALDADEAGDRAAERLAVDLHRAGALRVVRRRPNGANDWADRLAGGPS